MWTLILFILAFCVQFALCYSLLSNLANNTLPNQRLIGKLIASSKVIGPQMCINECVKRNCQSINYNRQTFECELNSKVDPSIPDKIIFQGDLDFIFIDISTTVIAKEGRTLHDSGNNETCDHNYVCIQLKSKAVECLEDLKPRDCKDLLVHGSTSNGVYTLYPTEDKVIRAYCDMTTDNGGWTVFQRRTDENVHFYRNWAEYKNGFGEITGNYWLGNDNLHLLLSNGASEMRMDMEDFDGNTRYLQYSSFIVGNEASYYQATLDGPSGNVADCLTTGVHKINNTNFVTFDHDVNDCANLFKGGWWYGDCHCANPNGQYLSGQTSIRAVGMVYKFWLGHYYSLKSTALKIRRKT